MEKKKIVAVASDELLDADLKKILGNRYQDVSHLFTEEAQERRRNNREIFTLRIAAFMGVLMAFAVWAHLVGIMSTGAMCIGIGICNLVVGYFAGVCVSHNKGWRD